METTNTPNEGTGYSVAEAATHIEQLLDSEGTTEQVDADNEADEVSNTLDAEVEDDTDTLETESEEVDLEEAEGDADEVEEPTVADPNEIVFEHDGQQITREEATKGYLRQSQFTKKMQELAEHRKKWVVQEVEFHQVRAQSEQVLNNLASHVAQVFEMSEFGQEPDWEYEFQTDPYEANLKRIRWEKDKAAWQQKQGNREAAVKAIYEAQTEVARQNEAFLKNKQQHEIIESREMLAQRLPDVFGDPQKANVRLMAMSSFLQDQGYSPDEIQNVTDARTIALAHYAMLGMESAKKVKAAVQKIEAKPAMTMPGTTTARTPTADQAFNKDRKRLKQSGSINDAAALISRLL
ncbi:hypothetical protein RMR21_015650 [Agrobacterium sp. rho-8.1]|nr:hypothetical protein [Agrobacterium sp. rho-8.1]